MARIIFIHGNGTIHWSIHFAGWLKDELVKLGFDTFFETFPDSIDARAEYWLPFLKDFIKAGPNDVIVGYSSGAVAGLRYAEENKLKGLILIGPSYTDLDDEAEKRSGYFNKPWDWEKIKSNVDKIAIFYGLKDPFIPQSEFEYIVTKLNTDVNKINDDNHFMGKLEFKELLDYIKTNF